MTVTNLSQCGMSVRLPPINSVLPRERALTVKLETGYKSRIFLDLLPYRPFSGTLKARHGGGVLDARFYVGGS